MKDSLMHEDTERFFKDHSPVYLEMALAHHRREIVRHPDGYGKKTRECGDSVEMFLSVRDEIISTVSYYTDGCLNTNACANAVAHLAEGKPLESAWGITVPDVVALLETLPEDSLHCADLALGAFRLALTDLCRMRRQPWRKLYR